MEEIVHGDERRVSSSSSRADEIRREVVGMAADRAPGSHVGTARLDSPHEFAVSPDLGDRAAMDLYLALLQDRLPIYVRSMVELFGQLGQGDVEENLIPVAIATINFYHEVLGAKVSVFAKPAQLVRLRQLLHERGLGPTVAPDRISAYLRKEQELGRVTPEVDTLAIARLLIGACLNYAFTGMLMGEDELPTREKYAADIVAALRLGAR
jgi:hypothetical protein